MKKKAIGMIMLLAIALAACSPAAVSSPATTSGPTATVPTTGPVQTTPAAEKPQYGGSLNLLLISDISSWDWGLTFC